MLELGELVPSAPTLLSRTRIEVGTVGGALHIASVVDPVPRPASFCVALSAQLQAFLEREPDVEELCLVAHVVGTLQLRSPEPALLLHRRLEGLSLDAKSDHPAL